MDNELILFEKKNRIGYVTINRPKQLNALNRNVLGELDKLISKLETDTEIGVVIITGSGEKSFIAGADVSELAVLDGAGAIEFNSYGSKIFRRLEKLEKPIIAAVNGYALGGGLELALACDIRVASENASFGNPEVTLGSIPGFGATQRLPRLIGTGLAKEIIFTSDRIDAQEAYRIGLVNHVVSLAELMETCEKLAGKILQASPIALKYAKKTIDEGMQVDLDTGLKIEYTNTGFCHDGPEHKTYINAFINRNKKK
jgi:enoyl-CoA hydratase